MNKKLIVTMALLATAGLLSSCGADKGTAITAEEAAAAINALDEDNDLAYTAMAQHSVHTYNIYEAIYKGYEAQVEAQLNGETLASYDYVYKADSTLKKYNNNVINALSHSGCYYNDAPETEVETSDVAEVIYVNEDGAFVDVCYYGEGSEDNFGYGMSAEYATLYYDCESWSAWFDTWGYGGNASAQGDFEYYSDAENYPDAVVSGVKYKNGAVDVVITIEAETIFSKVVTGGTFDYDPKVTSAYVETISIGKDGDVTQVVSGSTYMLCGSPVDGKDFDEPVLLFASALTDDGYSKADNGDYTGSYYEDVDVTIY